MPIDYEVQIEKANTINDLTNIKLKINYNYYVKHSPLRYSKLMTSIDDKMYLMTLTVKDAKDTIQNKKASIKNTIEKLTKTLEDLDKEESNLHKNPIIILSP
jgi:prefoldin subunit 5